MGDGFWLLLRISLKRKGIAENLKKSKRKIKFFDMKHLIATFLLLFTLSLSNSYAQEIQIDGKTFQTVKKTVLNTETEFYQVKENVGTVRESSSYIKSDNKYFKTVFTELEWKTFFKKGTISSLGKISKFEIGKSRFLNYINKGKTTILFKINKGSIKIMEFPVDMIVLFPTGPDGWTTDEGKACGAGCKAKYDECKEEFGPQTDDSDDPCSSDLTDCVDRCYHAAYLNGASYAIKTLNLSVKIK